MTPTDIDAALSLSTLSGWNQTEADWRRLLLLEPDGCFVACIEGDIRGTVTTTSYGQRLGWIGMVLVHPDVRRCGLGSALLRQGVAYLQSIGVETIKLDATPLGQPVYERAGFVTEYELERWEGTVSATDVTTKGVTTKGVTETDRSTPAPVRPEDFPAIIDFDSKVFGADRGTLLYALYQSAPEYSAVYYREGKVLGYAFGRRGKRANYLGPWVAADVEVAYQLAQSVLCHWPGEPVYVDVNLSQAHAVEVVQSLGLRSQRGFIRMYLGPNNFSGQPQWVCGIAGPELG